MEIVHSNQNSDPTKYTRTWKELEEVIKHQAKKRFIWKGIVENSFGFIYGPPKVGKTTLCEGLLIAIASGADVFLDEPIDIINRKTLSFSFEEPVEWRMDRMSAQIEQTSKELGNSDWTSNLILSDDRLPFNVTKDVWEAIEADIKYHEPGITVIDSAGYLNTGIEKFEMAMDLVRRIKETARRYSTAIVLIGHTPKLPDDKLLTYSTLAGSSALARQGDYMIGCNITKHGVVYMKDVCSRYTRKDNLVSVYDIGDNRSIKILYEGNEQELLEGKDGREDDTNVNKVFDFIKTKIADGSTSVVTQDVLDEFCTELNGKPKAFTKQTAQRALRILCRSNKLKRTRIGVYELP